ncbi:MAG: sulfatase-like hydrolase/transferase [Bacteroidales bacterium]
MQNYYQHILLFLKRFLLVLLLYTVSRLFFYLLNAGYFEDVSFVELLKLFLTGIRFDIAAIIFTNVIFILYLLPGSYKNYRGVQKSYEILFFLINSIALLTNFIDAKFFDFINKRITSSIFTLMGTNQDVWFQIPLFIKEYWYVVISYTALIILFWYCLPRLRYDRLVDEKISVKTFLYQTLVVAGILCFMLWGARGTALKPIGIIDAATYSELKLAPLVLNTPFSIIKTIENENLEEHRYFPEDSLTSIYYPVHQTQEKQAAKSMNVVIFILESFSREYSGFMNGGQGYTPCFDSILRKSLVYTNAFANGTQSYEAMPAIIAGMPSLMDKPYSGSNYADNIIESLPLLLRQEGYHTSFFHGGNNGTMGFNNFASVAGIEHYFGRNEYNNDADYDGHWGIWDEPYLQYFARQIDRFPQPFFTAVFTLSSHHPYNVPEKYKEEFIDDALPILKSIRYTDKALGEFFKTAQEMPWYHNTLFVFTADHAAQAVERIYNSSTGMYAIPIAFYNPSDSLFKGIDSTVAQQIDIMPTVLDYLGYPNPFFAFGESLFNFSVPHRAISFVNGMYQLIEGDYVMVFNGKNVTSFYNLKQQDEKQGVDTPDKITDPITKEKFSAMETSLKAILQTYNGCLINNRTSLGNFSGTNAQSPFVVPSKQLP